MDCAWDSFVRRRFDHAADTVRGSGCALTPANQVLLLVPARHTGCLPAGHRQLHWIGYGICYAVQSIAFRHNIITLVTA